MSYFFVYMSLDRTATNESNTVIIKQDDSEIRVTYTSGEYAKEYNVDDKKDENNILTGDGTFESNKEIYGYYILFVNGEKKGEYPLGSHTIQKNMSDDGVIVYFDAPLIEYSTIQQICQYKSNI